jgi:hypothetical protein
LGAETVTAVDIFHDHILLRAEDGTNRTIALAELKREVESAEITVEKQQPTPPSALVTFVESETQITAETAAEAVTPRRRRRRKKRGRHRGRGRNPTEQPNRESGGETDRGDRRG